MKKTEWFPVEMKPARPGWYEAKYDSSTEHIDMRYFDGYVWKRPLFDGHLEVCHFGNVKTNESREEWRGLAEKPE